MGNENSRRVNNCTPQTTVTHENFQAEKCKDPLYHNKGDISENIPYGTKKSQNVGNIPSQEYEEENLACSTTHCADKFKDEFTFTDTTDCGGSMPKKKENLVSYSSTIPNVTVKYKEEIRARKSFELECQEQSDVASISLQNFLQLCVRNEASQERNRVGVSTDVRCDGVQKDNYIDPQQVQIGQILGEGGFGRVFKAIVNGVTEVAAKLILVPFVVSEEELNHLLNLKHKNLVTFIGAVRQSSQMDPPQLVLMYYPEGNVLQFLSHDENPNDNGTLGKLAFDISEGCQFLHACNVVHGNLAARNVLVEKIARRNRIYYNAKISDFGIIRYAEPSGGNYMKVTGGKDRVLPLRWVPKEIIDGSISDFTFSSDVWSFGVVLWEMWTNGDIPYGATCSNQRIVKFLNDGYSPLKVNHPKGCPKSIVALMESVFQINPLNRPSFTELMVSLQHYKGQWTMATGSSGVKMGGVTNQIQSLKKPGAADTNKHKCHKESSDNSEGGKMRNKDKEKENTESDRILSEFFSQLTNAARKPTDKNRGRVEASAFSQKSQPHKKVNTIRDTSVDSQTVVELRKRIAQLEKEGQCCGGKGNVGKDSGARRQNRRSRSQSASHYGSRGGDNYWGQSENMFGVYDTYAHCVQGYYGLNYKSEKGGRSRSDGGGWS